MRLLLRIMSVQIGKAISNPFEWLTQPRPILKPRSRIDLVTNLGGYNYK